MTDDLLTKLKELFQDASKLAAMAQAAAALADKDGAESIAKVLLDLA